MEMPRVNAMVIDFKPGDQPGTRAKFSYHMTPVNDYDYGQREHISRRGSRSGLAQDRILASSPCHQIQDHGPTGPWRLARRSGDGKTATSFPLKRLKRRPLTHTLSKTFSSRSKAPGSKSANTSILRSRGKTTSKAHYFDVSPRRLVPTNAAD
jgi:hypothetical protein